MMKISKKNKQYLKLLPLQKRLQVVEEIRKQDFGQKLLSESYEHLVDLMYRSFTWHWSRQGQDYWEKVTKKIDAN